jgi:hypothetical protein
VDGREVRALVDAHLAGRTGLADVLWLLTNLYLWYETSFVDSAASQSSSRITTTA